MQRTLHWSICQLHGNELPLRHLLTTLDGKTSGPNQLTGPIGKYLTETKNWNELPVVSFNAIPSDSVAVSEDHYNELSTDQKYLLDMYLAVSTGICTPNLAARIP